MTECYYEDCPFHDGEEPIGYCYAPMYNGEMRQVALPCGRLIDDDCYDLLMEQKFQNANRSHLIGMIENKLNEYFRSLSNDDLYTLLLEVQNDAIGRGELSNEIAEVTGLNENLIMKNLNDNIIREAAKRWVRNYREENNV